MRIYDNQAGTTVDAISRLAISNTDVAGHWYDLSAPGYFAQLLFQRGDGTKPQESGVTTEAVLAAVLHRLEHLDGLLPCAENGVAIANIQLALYALEQRQIARAEQGVLGTSQPHESVLLGIQAASDEEAAQAVAQGIMQAGDEPEASPASDTTPPAEPEQPAAEQPAKGRRR